MIRDIVKIDEELCDGCGQCIPSCAEGALKLVNGKAKLISDVLCDGLGACLGDCPQNAIKILKREADEFDEEAVAAAAAAKAADSRPEPIQSAQPMAPVSGGCPGSRFMNFDRPAATSEEPCSSPEDGGTTRSELTHWPVQLHLLSPQAPVLRGASLLVAADCVPVAYADFHRKMLRGRPVVVACPKLDDPTGYVEKLTEMIRGSELREIVVAHMQVPCCMGLLMMVLEARKQSGHDISVIEITVSTQGEIIGRREIPAEAA